ncbi:MAG TPA: ATP-binding protein [Methylomirabilota bacterium]|nr:ATP-binding protein [Methylomirabilota bacterium]
MQTLAVLVIATLAAAVGGLAVWVFTLRRRVHGLERDLQNARAQAERLSRLGALGEMASSFAHAFNDVLTPVIGRTQLLIQRVRDPQLREWLDTIERAALDGAQTVRRIQEFMRARRDEPATAVDLLTTLRQAIQATASRRPGVHFQEQLDHLPPITGDPQSMQHALAHILANAVDAAPDGGVVTVSAQMEGGEAIVSVTDTGSGMTPGVQARVFEPFFTTKPGATGLGLCLAHGIVARHGGQIEIDSTAGRGTTVRVKFLVEGVSRAEPAASAPAAHTPSGPTRCLVVDDDPQVRQMISDILSNAGHGVVMAVDGADGIDKFKNDSSFDVVVTDLAMPKLNGLQLARMCKTLRPSVPVVMLTGWGVLLTEDELAEHGVDEVLSKPVRMDQLLSTLTAVLARTASA